MLAVIESKNKVDLSRWHPRETNLVELICEDLAESMYKDASWRLLEVDCFIMRRRRNRVIEESRLGRESGFG